LKWKGAQEIFPGNVGDGEEEWKKFQSSYFMLNIIHLPKFWIATYNQRFWIFFLETSKFPINFFIGFTDMTQISIYKKGTFHHKKGHIWSSEKTYWIELERVCVGSNILALLQCILFIFFNRH
jgi:hypothetical protein